VIRADLEMVVFGPMSKKTEVSRRMNALARQWTARPRRSFRMPRIHELFSVPFVVLALTVMTTTHSAKGAGSEPHQAPPKLAPCPDSPNCVSSDAPEGSHYVAPFVIEGSPEKAWSIALQTLSDWPRTEVVLEEPTFVRVECRSAWLRFVDDLELQLRAEKGIIAVRSASRVGYSDFGVNRKRVETLRRALEVAGVVR